MVLDKGSSPFKTTNKIKDMFIKDIKDSQFDIKVTIIIDEKSVVYPVIIKENLIEILLEETQAIELANTIIDYYKGNKVQ